MMYNFVKLYSLQMYILIRKINVNYQTGGIEKILKCSIYCTCGVVSFFERGDMNFLLFSDHII